MRSNFKRLGNYIEAVNRRNSDCSVTDLRGLSLTKEFRSSTSNIVGTDMSTYKVMHKYDFAANFMGLGVLVDKAAIVLKKDETPNIVSGAYPVFRVKDENILHPEYLMMWLIRSEFDRYCVFKSDKGIRGGFDWNDLLETELPIPSITKQREIVKEYNTIQNRIVLNQQLIQKFEETAQTIYKQWFVEFEFPSEDGRLYKSEGGAMVYCEDLEKEIPVGWEILNLNSITKKITDGSHFSPPSNEDGIPMASVKDMTDWSLDLKSSRIISENDYMGLVKTDCKPLLNDILIAKDGSFLKHIFVTRKEEKVVILSSIAIIRTNNKILPNILALDLKSSITKRRLTNSVNGGAIQRIVLKEFKKFKVVVPKYDIQLKADKIINPLLMQCYLLSEENKVLNQMSNVILSRLSVN